ncbi:MAG: imelysin family protein [Pseudomonadota bacterium]
MSVPPPLSMEEPALEPLQTDQPPEPSLSDPPPSEKPPTSALEEVPLDEENLLQPSVRLIVDDLIMPSTNALVGSALALQNLVVRHCANPARGPDQDLKAAFAHTVVAAAQATPLAFNATNEDRSAQQLFTEIADTAFSLSRLEALANGRVTPPSSLAALNEEEAAVVGLPALEYLLITGPFGGEATLSRRCRHALAVAANVHRTARLLAEAWTRGDVASHWTSQPVDLAHRLRLRDLIQGMMEAVNMLTEDVERFADRSASLPGELPFSSNAHTFLYFSATLDGLSRHAAFLTTMAEPDGRPISLLETLRRTLQDARQSVANAAGEDKGVFDPTPFRDAKTIILDELPGAFAFDRAAFDQPVFRADQ